MIRSPQRCSYRISQPSGVTSCQLVCEIASVSDQQLAQIDPHTCEACCRSLRAPEQINAVIASLVYHLASKIERTGPHPECSIARARNLKSQIMQHLALVHDKLPDQLYPRPRPDSVRHAGDSLHWATAVLTAPRGEPQLVQTLESLAHAELGNPLIFAEPGAEIPAQYSYLKCIRRPTRLGNLLNFYDALSTLLETHPSADVFAVFQDDVLVARNLKSWCDKQFWPLGCGVISLFTPQLHASETPGWRLLTPGFQRVCGAQALAFRRDMLERFLSDPRVLQCLTLRENGSDAVVGGWLSREQLPIAYHTPSLVKHTGMVSSLYRAGPDRRNLGDAVECVSQIPEWRATPRRTGTIGLVGFAGPTGLGTINRDLLTHLPIEHWFVPRPSNYSKDTAPLPRHLKVTRSLEDPEQMKRWASQLDWLLFAERPHILELPRLAAHQGVGIACIPMWEWIQPSDPWLAFVDVMLCPTEHTFRLMRDWKSRYGFGWKVVLVPWPVDANRYEFRQRQTCQEFLFVNGWGGSATKRPGGDATPYRRKGLQLILDAAAIAPDLRFVIQSLAPLPFAIPENVRVAKEPLDSRHLYREGDVCVQPSHYEGLGLQLLECQAAGMPLVTTNAPPMNEVQPYRTIPTSGREVIQVGNGFIAAELMHPQDLVQTLRPLVGLNVSEASRNARSYVETHRSWATAKEVITAELFVR